MSQKLSQTPKEIEVQRILGTEATTRESNTEKRKVEAALGRREGLTATIHSWLDQSLPHHLVNKVVYHPNCPQIQVEESS